MMVISNYLSHSGALLLWVHLHCHSLSVVCRVLTSSSQELVDRSLPNLLCSVCRVRRQEIVNFMTPHTRDNFGVKSEEFMKKNLQKTPQIFQDMVYTH